MIGQPLALELPNDLLEALAHRVADLLAEREAPAEADGYLDVASAADFLACPTSRIYSLVSAKRIPHHRDGSRLLFQRAELHAFVAAGGARRP